MFNAQDVKTLRDKTGAGMMDCKKALDATSGNIDEAVTWLREKGISKAEKKASRIAAEGIADALEDGNVASIVELNCETDFVARNDEFKALARNILLAIMQFDASTTEEVNNLVIDGISVAEQIVNFTAKIGEKISFRRFEKIKKTDDQVFGIYSHLGGKITSLVVLNGDNREVAKDVAMHVAAMKPMFLDITSVDSSALDREREIFKEQAINEGKPSDIAEKMVEGRIKKYYKEVCLTEQPFIKDPGLSVSQYAKSSNCSIVSMIRYEVGEGIEKKQENFADEVNKQING